MPNDVGFGGNFDPPTAIIRDRYSHSSYVVPSGFSDWIKYSNNRTLSHVITSIERKDGLPDNCGKCLFVVTKEGQTVYQETRAICPEVEKLPCRLNDERKEVKIEKFAYLERAEVVPYFYQNFGLGVFQAKIPDECLCIYKNTLETIIPQFYGFPTPTNTVQNVYGYITQICSAPGCPPPEYQVLCDCNDCENCPPDTCAVNCDGNICCYDNSGVSIKEIAVADYCEGTV